MNSIIRVLLATAVCAGFSMAGARVSAAPLDHAGALSRTAANPSPASVQTVHGRSYRRGYSYWSYYSRPYSYNYYQPYYYRYYRPHYGYRNYRSYDYGYYRPYERKYYRPYYGYYRYRY